MHYGSELNMAILNIQKAAEFLNISPRTVETLINNKKIPAVKLQGRWMISDRLLQEYIETLSLNNLAPIATPKKTPPSKSGRRRNNPFSDKG